MFSDKRLAVIGAGMMGDVLVKAILQAQLMEPEQVVAADLDEAKLKRLQADTGVGVTTDNLAAVAKADLIILAVKPQVMRKVLGQIGSRVRPEQLVISIAAGITTGVIEAALPPGTAVIRAMPNSASLVRAGMTVLAMGKAATAAGEALASEIFRSIGPVILMPEEMLDAATGLSGSGPAYVYLFIEALADAGVRVGFTRETALQLAARTVYGAAKMVLETGEHPAVLKDMVTSPAGTAIAGLHELERKGLRGIVMDAVVAAWQRSRELGREGK
ncbi:MAG: pyrroline-5-carboxylate reductase [Syntrophothermus sp.]